MAGMCSNFPIILSADHNISADNTVQRTKSELKKNLLNKGVVVDTDVVKEAARRNDNLQ